MKIYELLDVETFTYKWNFIERIPEFAKLKECKQNPRWHSEGSAWEHTRRVCEQAAETCKHLVRANSDKIALLMASALFHDIGKGVTTKIGKDGNWHSYGHEFEGERITRYLLWNECLREEICALVRLHMEYLHILEHHDYLERINKMSKETFGNFDILTYLKKCDCGGSIQVPDNSSIDNAKIYDVEKMAIQMGVFSNYSNIASFGHFNIDDHYRFFGDNKAEVTVLIGLAGAGKSTYIKKHLNSDKYAVISRDIIRAELGYCNPDEKVVLEKEQEDKVTEHFNKKILDAIKEGKHAVIDNLNLKRKYRDAYKTLLKDYAVTWNYVYVETDSLEKNIERRESSKMDMNVFKNMIMNFDWPTPDEYHTIRIETT